MNRLLAAILGLLAVGGVAYLVLGPERETPEPAPEVSPTAAPVEDSQRETSPAAAPSAPPAVDDGAAEGSGEGPEEGSGEGSGEEAPEETAPEPSGEAEPASDGPPSEETASETTVSQETASPETVADAPEPADATEPESPGAEAAGDERSAEPESPAAESEPRDSAGEPASGETATSEAASAETASAETASAETAPSDGEPASPEPAAGTAAPVTTTAPAAVRTAEEPPEDTPEETAEETAEATSAEPEPREQEARLPTEAPAADPGTPEPAGSEEPEGPRFDIVRVDPDGNLVAAGRAAAGTTVELRSGDLLIGRARADSRGEWVMTPDRPLPPGGHELRLSAGEEAAARPDAEVVVVSVPRPAAAAEVTGSGEPEAPAVGVAEQVVAPAGEIQAEAPLAVVIPGDPEAAPRVLQGPIEGLEVGGLALESLTYDEAGRLRIAGRVAAGGRVFVYVDEDFVDEAAGGEDGRWQLRPEAAVSEGLHRLRLDQVDEAGRVLARLETPFVRSDFVGGGDPSQRFVVVQPGNSLWRIARGSYGSGLEFTLIFEANQDQIRDPDLIYPGQIFLVP